MKRLMILAVTLVCMGASHAYADYSFNFNSGDGTLVLNGNLLTNGNIITGGTLLSTGTEYNNITFAVGSLSSVLGPCPQGVSGPGYSTFMGYGGAYATYDNLLTGNATTPFNVTNSNVNQNMILAASTNDPAKPGYYLTLAYDGGSVYDSYNITPSSQVDTVFANATATATPTPVPAAAWLLGSGLIGLFGVRRKKS